MTDPTPEPTAQAPLSAQDDRLWGSLAHLGGILYFLPSLIIYLIFKDRGSFTREEAKEALNWQITFVIATFVVGIVGSIVAGVLYATGAYAIAGVVGSLNWILYLVNLIFSIIGFVKSKEGVAYRYPIALRLIK